MYTEMKFLHLLLTKTLAWKGKKVIVPSLADISEVAFQFLPLHCQYCHMRNSVRSFYRRLLFIECYNTTSKDPSIDILALFNTAVTYSHLCSLQFLLVTTESHFLLFCKTLTIPVTICAPITKASHTHSRPHFSPLAFAKCADEYSPSAFSYFIDHFLHIKCRSFTGRSPFRSRSLHPPMTPSTPYPPLCWSNWVRAPILCNGSFCIMLLTGITLPHRC